MKRVLVVDDEDDVREIVAEVLRSYGYDVCSAANGRTALEALSSIQLTRQPCVVVTDFQMPGMNGAAVAREIRRTPAFSAVRVLLLTAARPLPGCDADAVMAKPFELADLRRTVERLFALTQ